MGNVFDGWRRKTGCVLLVIAGGLICGWGRSLGHNDELNIWTGPRATHSINSSPTGLCWMRRSELSPRTPMLSGRFGWVAFQTFAGDTCDPFRWSTAGWHARWGGFQFAEATINPPDVGKLAIWIIPYWSLVIPLTVFSAGLILWRPRQTPFSSEKKPAPPRHGGHGENSVD